MTGILLSFAAALCFGTSTFCGGFTTRRNHQFQIVILTAFSGFLVLLIASWLKGEELPSRIGILWSLLAGLSGTIGVASLFLALSIGNSATVAPTAAVIGTAFPVIFTILVHGSPAPMQLSGFILAFFGIWFVTRQPSANKTHAYQRSLLLTILAGISLGGFFLCIAQVEPDKIVTPLLLTRAVTFLVSLFLLRAYRLPLPALRESPLGLLVGVLDAGGDIFFMVAKLFTRIDTVIIICSFNSAIVAPLTALFLKEKISNWQKLGVVLCVLSIILISI